MHSWNAIHSKRDIQNLLEAYGGFHDACLVDVFYRSGARVTDQNAMVFGPSDDHVMFMTFHSQWHKEPLELCFTGVKRCNIVGFQSNYSSEILDCYLAFHTDLITGHDDPLIVWADYAGFSPYSDSESAFLSEPATTYVVAEKMKWRFVSVQQKNN